MATVQPTWGEIVDPHSSLTADDLLRLPDDGYKYELYEGVLVREMTSPGHGAVCQRIGFELGLYARATGIIKLDQIVQNALFDLAPPSSANRESFAPDVAILRPATPLSWNVPRDTPLLAVEVVSESQTLAELATKAQVYRQAGVDEIWIVDYKSRSVEIWNAAGVTTIDEAQSLTSALLPGFGVEVRYLLDG